MSLNTEQTRALYQLTKPTNTFLTGSAGTGKSHIIKEFLKYTKEDVTILSSTGVSALLINGTTFHRFFGLGIIDGGPAQAFEQAKSKSKVMSAIRSAKTVIIDEISMISGEAFDLANRIAQYARNNKKPFGGLKLIVVGDFLQLPPVGRYDEKTDWSFSSQSWVDCQFTMIDLIQIMRTSEQEYSKFLQKVRVGISDTKVAEFLVSRFISVKDRDAFIGTVLFPRKLDVEDFNQKKLDLIKSPAITFKTKYTSKSPHYLKAIQSNLPISDTIVVKAGAIVMIRMNDPEGGYANGTLAKFIKKTKTGSIALALLSGKGTIFLEKYTYKLLDENQEELATASNYPITLAWASTIHKAQGATIDRICVDISRLWEPGQAYVALSRAKSKDGLYVSGFTNRSIFSNKDVIAFYSIASEASVSEEAPEGFLDSFTKKLIK
jgi:ATP-dependent DNA helicase PIF1